MRAEVIEHKYSSGSKFWTVECKRCNVVCNSGHHYSERDLHYAYLTRDNHNIDHGH